MRLSILVPIASVLALVACGDDSGTKNEPKVEACGMPTSCAPENGADVELVCPQGGESFAPGDTVTIMWRATNIADFTGFVPQVSADAGNAYMDIIDTSIIAEADGPDAQCFSYDYVVPEDGSLTPDDTDNDAVIFRIKDYSITTPNMRDASEAVTVVNE
jgi:hypothetical protein